jgi:hypothetical protein
MIDGDKTIGVVVDGGTTIGAVADGGTTTGVDSVMDEIVVGAKEARLSNSAHGVLREKRGPQEIGLLTIG